jgi:hypothetical protein
MSNNIDVNAGDKTDLPDFVREIAKPRSQVIAWSHVDPELEPLVGKFLFWEMFGNSKYR